MASFFSFGSIFGGGSAARKNQQSKEAIIKLRQQLEMLRKREIHTEKQIAEQDAIARKHVSTNKTIARNALKRKKAFETNLQTTQQHINTLEQQMNAVETANLNLETIKVMKEASDVMHNMHKGIGIDTVDETMEGIRESMQLNKEISEAITSVNIAEDDLEDELDAQLESLEQENLDKTMIGAPSVPFSDTLSAVKPVTDNAAKEDDEEEELRKLQAEMAI